jgi:hypothetical protein
MQNHDKQPFVKAVNLCFSTLGKPVPDRDSLRLWWALLERFDLVDVEQALLQHVSASKFAPVPADVVTRIDTRIDGWPGENEAWAIAKLAYAKPGEEERNTVVICNEIEQALDAVRHLIDEGDYSAPRAFKEAYKRISDDARKALPVPRWRVSRGTDPVQREQIVQKAVNEGRLSLADGRAAVPLLAARGDDDPIDAETAAANRSKVAGLLAILSKPKAAKPAPDMDQGIATARAEAAEQARKAAEYVDAQQREKAEAEAYRMIASMAHLADGAIAAMVRLMAEHQVVA